MLQDSQQTCIIELLGPFRAAVDGRHPKLRRKTRALLAFLATTQTPHRRQVLCDLFFPESNNPLAALRWQLSQLRKEFHPDLVESSGDTVALNLAGIELDLDRFRSAFSTDISHIAFPVLQAAESLYRGEFLEGLWLADAPTFELWLLSEQTEYRRLYLRGLDEISQRLIDRGKHKDAIEINQKRLQIDPLVEAVHMQLMMLFSHSGQREAALRQYEQCRKILEQELAVEPTLELQTLHLRIASGQLSKDQEIVDPPKPEQIVVDDESRHGFIGRNDELMKLKSVWQDVKNGIGRVLLIDAEAGGGKTELIREFARQVLGQSEMSSSLIEGRCYESTSSLPYQPWIGLLESYLASWSDSQLAQVPQNHRESLSRLLPRLSLSRAGRLNRSARQQDEIEQAEIFSAITEILLRVSGSSKIPQVFFLDDLQWADESSLHLVVYAAQRVRGTQVLLIGAFRSEERTADLDTMIDDLTRMDTTRISLSPLTQLNIAAMTRRRWPHLPPSTHEQILEQLLRATGGNALFVTSLLRELAQGHQFSAGQELAKLHPLPVPATVRELIHRRLNQLSGSEQQILEAIAVLSTPVSFVEAQQISGRSDEETANAIEKALNRLLLQVDHTLTAPRYHIYHDLIQQAVLEQLSPIRRQRLHQRSAEALERLQTPAATIMYHWAAAGNLERERLYAAKAGQQAAKQAASAEAVALFTRAIELTPEAAKDEQFDHLLAREKVYALQGAYQTRMDDLEELQLLADALDDNQKRAQVALRRSDALLSKGLLEQANELAKDAVIFAVMAADVEIETLARSHAHSGDSVTGTRGNTKRLRGSWNMLIKWQNRARTLSWW